MRVDAAARGYSLSEADTLRKGGGEEEADLMAEERSKFVDSVERQGYERAFGVEMFDSSSRSPTTRSPGPRVRYGFIAYQNRVLEGQLIRCSTSRRCSQSVKSNQDKASVLPERVPAARHPRPRPDVNDSRATSARSSRSPTRMRSSPRGAPTEVARRAIRFGLSAVAHVGEGVAELSCARRDGGPFMDFYVRRYLADSDDRTLGSASNTRPAPVDMCSPPCSMGNGSGRLVRRSRRSQERTAIAACGPG